MAKITALHEEEKAMLEGEIDIVIPFSLTYGKTAEIAVYPMFKAVAEKFFEKFGEDAAKIFSDEGISWILKSVGEAVTELGFAIGEESEDYFITRKILPSDNTTAAVLIESAEGLCNLTDYDIEAMTEYGHICCGIVKDGKILSVACTNAPIDTDTKGTEIGVETAEGYGGHGYGRDSVAALANELHWRGVAVHYEYASKNQASEALVSGLDTEITAKTYYLVGIRE